MANAATLPAQGQILVNIDDIELYSSYELSLRDLDEGRVTTHASVDDYFKKFGL